MVNFLKKYKFDLIILFYIQCVQSLLIFYENKYNKIIEIILILLLFFFVRKKITYYYKILFYEIITMLIEYFYFYNYPFKKEFMALIVIIILVEIKYKYIKKVFSQGKEMIINCIIFLFIAYIIKYGFKILVMLMVALVYSIYIFFNGGIKW